jgi:hypothetical protein
MRQAVAVQLQFIQQQRMIRAKLTPSKQQRLVADWGPCGIRKAVKQPSAFRASNMGMAQL